MMVLAAAMLTGAIAFAAGNDTKTTGSDTVDHSTNPLTGTKKTVKKHKHMSKSAAGDTESKSTETTKEYKDGNVKKTTEKSTTTETK